MPAAGSSSRISDGRRTTARAISSRRCMPYGRFTAFSRSTGVEAEPREHLVDGRLGRAGRGRGLDVLPDGELREQPDVLERAREPELRDPVRRASADLLVAEDDASAGRRVDARHDVQERGLARAVRPDQAEDLAVAHLDVDAGERGESLEALLDVLAPQDRARPSPRPGGSAGAAPAGMRADRRPRLRARAAGDGASRRSRSSISQRSNSPSGRRISVMMMSSAITNWTVPVMRGSSHGPIETPCSTRASVSVRNVMIAAPATAPVSEVAAADHEHREQRERDREVELVRVERDHALRPERAGRAHHGRAEDPRPVPGADDVRPHRRRRQRVLPGRPQAQARPRVLVEAAEQQERDRADRGDAERRPDRDRRQMPSEPRVNVVAFCRNVCTTTSSASVAIAIVDSVIRIMPPPKIAAHETATSADTAIAGTQARGPRSRARTAGRAAAPP